MKASVLIEYSVKTLDKTFDYLVPFSMEKTLKVGHKVLVPFGLSSKKVEGFVMNISNETSEYEMKEIDSIVEEDFILNEELLELGKFIKGRCLCTLISAYQTMLPKALKASNKTNINIKYNTYVSLNDVDYNKYILEHKRNTKEIEIINKLILEEKILKSLINGSALRSLINKGIVKESKEEVKRCVNFISEEKRNITLNESQSNAVKEILKERDNKEYLLYGVTGSGKTEVYIKVIDSLLKEGKSAIVLVPEISLTPQIVSRFKSEFESDVAVLHSRLSEGEKYDEYRRIIRENVKVVVGARSAVFAPLKNIGTIIIDESHSESYRQENNPKYDAIEVAKFRCKKHNAILVLGSATPTLETFARAKKGVYNLVTLTSRFNEKDMPKVHLVDMTNEYKKRNYMMSEVLLNKIQETIDEGRQAIVLLNRRGHSTFIKCTDCGYVYKCPNCDISLTYHKTSNNFRCHYCGFSTPKKEVCPNCKGVNIKNLGYGTEKLEEYLKNKIDNAKIVRMDIDTTYTKGSHAKIIDDFKNEKYNILVGTQMISKGLNFPKVTLVGVVNADASLYIPDFRSSERTFSLLTQTSGRSGRDKLQGEVYIETSNIDNYVFNYIKNYDYLGFYEEEMNIRKVLKYPPYFYITKVQVISDSYEKARDESVKVKKYLDNKLDDSFIILGPTTSSTVKLKNKYHFSILIKYKKEGILLDILNEINNIYTKDDVKLELDINS